jgi:hypothetical protein
MELSCLPASLRLGGFPKKLLVELSRFLKRQRSDPIHVAVHCRLQDRKFGLLG